MKLLALTGFCIGVPTPVILWNSGHKLRGASAFGTSMS